MNRNDKSKKNNTGMHNGKYQGDMAANYTYHWPTIISQLKILQKFLETFGKGASRQKKERKKKKRQDRKSNESRQKNKRGDSN